MAMVLSNGRQSRGRSNRTPTKTAMKNREIPPFESRNVTQQLVSRMDEEIEHQRKINDQLEYLLALQQNHNFQ